MGNLSGTELSKKIKAEIAAEVDNLITSGKRAPHLVTIIVGDNQASKVYVANKKKACAEVGFKTTSIEYPENISEDRLIESIEEYSADPLVDGVLVQLPLPKHINTDNVLKAIHSNKDVDGFHPSNVAKLWLGDKCVKPCTPQGIIGLIDYSGVNLEGKHVVVLGRSNIVGLPVTKMCLDRNATVTVCHSRTANLAEITRTADVLIVAIGKPKFVTADMIGENTVVIDVGINRDKNGKLCGDVDYEYVSKYAKAITPVPGGVGPMTIACLLKNTLQCYKR